jgi:hypothetical protein
MAWAYADITTSFGDVGKPSTSEVTTANKTDFCRRALSAFNERIHDYRIRTFTTIADTQEYMPSVTPRLIMMVWQESPSAEIIRNAMNVVGMGGKDFVELTSNSGLSGWDQISSYMQAKTQLQAWQKLSGVTWKYINGKILLIPTPTASGEYVAYLSCEDWTIGTLGLKDRFQSVFENLYVAEQLRFLSTKRLQQAGVNPVTGSLVEYPYDKLKALAKDYRDEANTMLTRIEAEQRLLT